MNRPQRLLITNHHVVGDYDTVEAVFPAYDRGELVTQRGYYADQRKQLQEAGRIVSGRVLHRDRGRDLALIQLASVPDDAVPLPLARSSARPGETVHSIGNRRELEVLWVYTAGTTRQVHRTDEGYFWQGRKLAGGARVVVTQSLINEGDSGGPLTNDQGEVIGVNAAVQWQAPQAAVGIDVAELRTFLAQAERPASPAADRGPAASAGAEVYRRTLRSTAWVRTAGSARGTGWLLDRDRKLLITAAAVAAGQDRTEVIFPAYREGEPIVEPAYYRDHGRRLQQEQRVVTGRVLVRDPLRQLALLELDAVPADAVALPLASASPRPGERVHGLGNPNGIEALWIYAAGAVRQVGRASLHPTEPNADVRVVLVQLPVNNGDRGGPLVNDAGQLVGVLGGKESPQQLVSYCVAVDEVKVLVAASRALWDPCTAAEFHQRGLHDVRSGQFRRAVEAFTAALRLDPQAAASLAERGNAWRLAGDLEHAVADCDAALQLKPDLPVALCHRAAAFNDRGAPERALCDCSAALRLDSKCAAAYSNRANAYRLRGDLDQALADCAEALWLNRQLASASFHRGLVFHQKGEAARAVADFTQAIELDAYKPGVYRYRADSYRQLGKLDWALGDLGRAIEIDAADFGAYFQRARLRDDKGSADLALADYVRGLGAIFVNIGKSFCRQEN